MRRPLLMVMAILALVMAAGCYDLPPDLNCTPEPGPRLVVRADSLGKMAEPIAQPAIHADYDTGPTCYTAAPGTQINNHSASLPQLGVEDCVVMELGTNDISSEVHQQTEVDLHQAADELADTGRQIWFTLNVTGGDLRGTPYSSRTRWFNDELLRMDADDARWPNLVVWRWDIESLGHPEWLSLPDKIHYNAVGTEHFAASLTAAAEACPFPVPTPATATTVEATTSQAVRATDLVAA